MLLVFKCAVHNGSYYRIEKGFYPKHHLVQLHRKPITTTKAFSFLYKRTIHHFHLFRYRASLFAHKPNDDH